MSNMSSKAFPKPQRNPLFPPCGKCRDRRSIVHLLHGPFTGWWCLPCLEIVAPETAKVVARSIAEVLP